MESPIRPASFRVADLSMTKDLSETELAELNKKAESLKRQTQMLKLDLHETAAEARARLNKKRP